MSQDNNIIVLNQEADEEEISVNIAELIHVLCSKDEKDLNKVHFDIELYRIYVKGYLEMAKDVLTPAENASLPWGARLMTLECGMRFLADFLQGDVYFKTTYPEHNLVRARTQFRLVKEMEEQFDQMQEIVETF